VSQNELKSATKKRKTRSLLVEISAIAKKINKIFDPFTLIQTQYTMPSPNVQKKFSSSFKNITDDKKWFGDWVSKIEKSNNRSYTNLTIPTSLGNTHVFSIQRSDMNAETLVIFPGARTSAFFWDLDRGLDNFKIPLNIFLVETNGLPNLSDGHSPDIHSNDYGHWANEVFLALKIQKAFIAGASFGGLVCMKLAITNPEKIKAAFLLNPGCLQSFSMSLKNLYYNILPIVKPTEKNVNTFLAHAVFCKPTHDLSATSYKLLVDYECFALTRYVDKTQKPYFMSNELKNVKTETHLVVGDKDLLFPYQRSIANAEKLLPGLKSVKVFENVGHGIETYAPALEHVGKIISEA
jgi:pimeloyl-ACP methyl ester carboxylesterase